MRDERQTNTAFIVFLILISMGIILFCCYLIYRQNIIITKNPEIKENCIQQKFTFNYLSHRENDQIIHGTGSTIFRKAILYKDGKLCISYERKNEELKESCMTLKNPIYMYSSEKDKGTYLYVIMDDGSITEISFNSNFDTNIVEKYHNLKNIIRIYTDSDDVPVFVSYNGKEYRYAGK